MEKVNIKIRFLPNDKNRLGLKQFQILDKELRVVSSKWISENASEENLAPDIYVVRVVLPNGEKFQEIVNVSDGQKKIVRLGESLDSVVLNNINKDDFLVIASGTKPELDAEKGFPNIIGNVFYDQYLSGKTTAFLWSYENGKEEARSIPEFKYSIVDSYGQTIKMKVNKRSVSRFEIRAKSGYSLFVLLPPVGTIVLTIKSMAALIDIENEFDISVRLPNLRAQALLELLNRGEINRAKSLMENFDIAENLLYSKMTDPTSAAVGAYYLLKTRELERLHSWAANLAERFIWLADGPIIYAWQMLLQDGEKCSIEIRKQLLESCKRGYPVFTEGLRLLYEGLVRCSFFFGKDDLEVEKALNDTKRFLASADLSQETTTYRVNNPAESATNLSDRLFLY